MTVKQINYMNKSIQFFILSSLLFSLCLTQEETLEGKMDYKDDGCSPVEDEDALTVEEEICHGRTAKLSDGSCCVLTFDNSEEGKAAFRHTLRSMLTLLLLATIALLAER